jgi:hypothetical protein
MSMVAMSQTPQRQTSVGHATPSSVPNVKSVPKVTPFRLQPRGGTGIATPPSLGSSRGRKRTAQCLGTPPAAADLATDLFPLSPVGTAQSFLPRPLAKPSSGGDDWCVTPSAAIGWNPLRVESAMQSLSIKSPRNTRTPDVILTPPRHHPTPIRAMGSSFSAYSPSPMATKPVRGESRSSAGLSGKMSSPSPASTKSSPKLAPLRLIQQLGKEGESSTSTPSRMMPPRHLGPSSMLLSINSSSSRRMDDQKGSDDDKMMSLETSMISLPSMVMDPSPQFQIETGMQQPETPQRPKPGRGGFLVLSPKPRPSPRTPIRTPVSVRTPGRTTSHRFPHTPLPSTTLTPRSTPSSRHGMSSPIFDLGLTLPTTFTPRMRNDVSPVARRLCSEYPPARWDAGQPTSEAAEKSPSASAAVPTQKDAPKTYLPMQGWYSSSPSANQMFDATGLDSVPTSVGGSPTHASSREVDPSTPEVQTRSLLAPPKTGSMLREMANEFAPSMDDDDSLTDDEDPFLLFDPAFLVEEKKSSSSRSRQRPRLSYGSLDQTGIRQSSTSLASSMNASNTSLLGMNFLRGDSMASHPQRDFLSPPVAASNKVYKRERSASQNSMDVAEGRRIPEPGLSRLRSVDSFGSIGLTLDSQPTDQSNNNGRGATRDLATPPPAMAVEISVSPPPRPNESPYSDHHHRQNAATSSVCIARSDQASVNFAISKMVFQTHQTYQASSPGIKCSG